MLERPGGDPLRGRGPAPGHDQHPVAVDRALARHGSSGRSPSDQSAGSEKRISAGRRSRPPSSSGRPIGDDLAGVHDRDPVGEVLRLVHVVGGQEHRLAELAQRADRRPRLAPRAPGRSRSSARRGRSDPDRRPARAPGRAAAADRRTASWRATSRFSPSSTSSITSSTGRRRDVIAAVHLDQLGDRQVVLNAALLEHDPDPLAQLALARSPDRCPSTRTSPPVRVR